MVTHVENKDYFAIQYTYLNFRYKLFEMKTINSIICANDTNIFKIIINMIRDTVCCDYKKEIGILFNEIVENKNIHCLKYFLKHAGMNMVDRELLKYYFMKKERFDISNFKIKNILIGKFINHCFQWKFAGVSR